jgi:hypothetical protein
MEQQAEPSRRMNAHKAAILVMEHGSLWPGRSLDWAAHVSVVVQPARRGTDSTLSRVRRAVDAHAVRLRSLECIAVAFADVADPASFRRRSELVNGLSAVLLETGCRRLVLAAYHTERLDLADLVELGALPNSEPAGRLRVELSFRRASNLPYRPARARH